MRTYGGKVLVPTREAVPQRTAARLATDVMNVPMVLLARTDANAASLLTSTAVNATPLYPHEGMYR